MCLQQNEIVYSKVACVCVCVWGGGGGGGGLTKRGDKSIIYAGGSGFK